MPRIQDGADTSEFFVSRILHVPLGVPAGRYITRYRQETGWQGALSILRAKEPLPARKKAQRRAV